MRIEDTTEYLLISNYYGETTTKRSKVRLMNHIDEGTKLLTAWGRPMTEKKAFCIHPLVQNNIKSIDMSRVPKDILELASEYALKANNYLCNTSTDLITYEKSKYLIFNRVGRMSQACGWMLLADKVQNQADFRKYHWFTHPRKDILDQYFNLWIDTIKAFYI